MCIAIISTAHPSYPLILIDNRDEYLNRPTAQAGWWAEPHSDVIGGRDLLRKVQGTWLGMTKSGKIAVLTNYREDSTPPLGAVSRGAIIRKFLTEDVGPMDQFVHNVVDTGVARDAGGFSLACGHVGEKLAIISNRAKDQTQIPWIAGDVVQTVALSNAAFADRSWKKVTIGEEMMLNAIRAHIDADETEDQLIQRLLGVLSHNTLEKDEKADEAGLDGYILKLRESIFVPPVGRKLKEGAGTTIAEVEQLGVSGLYGTQKQTIVLIDREMNARYFERTLFDSNSQSIPFGKGDVDYRFKIGTSPNI